MNTCTPCANWQCKQNAFLSRADTTPLHLFLVTAPPRALVFPS